MQDPGTQFQLKSKTHKYKPTSLYPVGNRVNEVVGPQICLDIAISLFFFV